jgi:hypothetical protein
MSGIGGIERRPNANPRSISLGGVPLVRHTLTHDTSLTVGIIPRTRIGSLVIDGLLGRDFLSLFDLDLNLPARSLTLYQVQDCSGRFLPWTDNYAVIPVTAPAGQALVVPVSVDGKPLQALLDSGASSSLIDAPGMFRLGLQQASLNGDPAEQITGIGTRTVTEYRHTFHSLQVGAEIIDRPTIWVAPIRIRPFADMLLGADWLSGRRVWVSFATKQVFVSRALSSN